MKHLLLAGAIASAFAAPGAFAQQQSPQPAPSQATPPAKDDKSLVKDDKSPGKDDKAPVKKLESITVTASPLSSSEETMAQPVDILRGEELRRKRQPSLGDTLSQEPGVQSSSFGAGAGRPIIRGFDAARVQVLENGVGTLDVSSISPDHAVTTEPLRARQIEVLRGPATLLYGGGAIGGVVNVVTDTIPREPQEAVSGAIEARGATANKLGEGAFDITSPLGTSFAIHADAFKRRTSDYDTPLGTLADSFTDSKGANVGASWVGERGFLGASAGTLRNDYGIPSGSGARIAMKQEREDIAGELANPFAGFTRLKVRAGFNDYEHREIEESGEVATTFKNKAWETRMELLHAPLWGLEGALGLHLQHRDFSAVGEETVIPPTTQKSTAAFIVERKSFGDFTLEGGARIERERRDPEGDYLSRSFDPRSFSGGVVWKIVPDLDLHVNATSSERAPSIEELYSNGAHDATASFEVGNQDLKQERARTLDVTLHHSGTPMSWKVTLFASRIRDYIYASSVDLNGDGIADRIDDLLLQQYTQKDAYFRGFEAEWSWRPESKAWGLRVFGDGVRASIDGAGNVPRMAPARIGTTLDAKHGPWSADLTVIHAWEAKNLAPLETPTPGYTKVDAGISYAMPLEKGRKLTYYLQGVNLSDAVIRAHTSYLKDVAPLMGRSFLAGVRFEM
ncbi:hypothetical protein BWI17_10340 [Betaproteobacteria bacterium GR16-43]|nr:hypothetical protein BWI17_10340 [Betaproteobacteria bacterium GR16-43]